MKSIALIGAGNIGSRHVQGICIEQYVEDIVLWVVDPQAEQLELVKQRLIEVGVTERGNKRISINYLNDLHELPQHIDIAIIATNSFIRLKVIRVLSEHASVDFLILEKFLFPTESDYELANDIFNSNEIKSFVNCPRRLYPYYEEIKGCLAPESGPIHFSFEGSNFGLSSNAIHRLDLFAYFIGHSDFTCELDLVNQELHASKRQGYYELTGKIKGNDTAGNTYHMTSFQSGRARNLVTVSNSEHRWFIDENEGFYYYSGIDNGWEWKRHEFQVVYQSLLTGKYIQAILATAECGLTTYQESARLHKMFLEKIRPKYEAEGLVDHEIVPIT